MSDIAIHVENLAKIYKLYDKSADRLKESLHPRRKKYHHDFYALNNVNFEVKKGETLGIIGQNGSGKSTLLKIITGVLSPTAGRVHVNGRISSLLELGTGFNPEMTGIENIYFYGTINGLTKAETDSKLDEILGFADIADFIYQPVKTYSSGMFVRLAFACAINIDPEILIIDEALAVGDIRFQLKCYRKLDEFRDKGITILFVSHSTGDILRLCDKVVWLNKGIIHRQGKSKAIVEEYHAWMIHDTGLQQIKINTDLINDKNDELIPIPMNAMITGEDGAIVEAVGFFSEQNRMISILNSAQNVTIKYKIKTKKRVEIPYFGFQIINAKDLRIMGCNNHVLGINYPPIESGKTVFVSFSFFFPEIENGYYFIGVGINDGTLETHIRYSNVWDAYMFQFFSDSMFQRQSVILKLPECKLRLIDVSKGLL